MIPLLDMWHLANSDDRAAHKAFIGGTATIAWENCSSKFNRALRVQSQELWSCNTTNGTKPIEDSHA